LSGSETDHLSRRSARLAVKKKAAAADKVSSIVRHRASIVEGDGFRYAQPILRVVQ
jgi:hypothetical protein